MQNSFSSGLAALVAFSMLGGCAAAASNGSPSLAKRAIEETWNVPVSAPAPTPPGPLPTDLAGRLARWAGDARAAEAAFQAQRPETEQLVAAAAGSGISTESWVVGQQALSRLQATRAPITGALADIDRLYIDRRVAGVVDGLPEIYALREQLVAIVAAQNVVLERLQAQMREN